MPPDAPLMHHRSRAGQSCFPWQLYGVAAGCESQISLRTCQVCVRVLLMHRLQITGLRFHFTSWQVLELVDTGRGNFAIRVALYFKP